MWVPPISSIHEIHGRDVTCSQPGNVSDTWSTRPNMALVMDSQCMHRPLLSSVKWADMDILNHCSYPRKAASSRISESNLVRRMGCEG